MPEPMKPPGIPSAMLNFFAQQPGFPAIAGDMTEEFQLRAQRNGEEGAKSWFWREAFRNSWALTARELWRTPVQTTLVALNCWLAGNLATRLYAFFHFHSLPAPWDLALASLLHLLIPLVMGLVGGKLLPDREWALALTFTAFSLAVFYAMHRWPVSHPHPLPWAAALRFSLGSLLVRYFNSGRHSSIVSAAKSA